MSGLAEEELDQPPAGRWLRIAGGMLLAVLAGVAMVYLLKDLGGSGPVKKKQVTRITVLPDTPPPPPPPKEEPKQPKETREVKVDQPKPAEVPQPQQSEQLKMEGQAGDGPSPFAAGTVTRENAFGTGGRMAFSFYTNNLQRYLQEELAKDKRLRRADYRVRVRLWLAQDGAIQRVEISGSSGTPELDDSVRSALSAMPPVRERPPEGMPQPVHLRITNRGAA